MKTLDYMIGHALSSASDPNAEVGFAVDSLPQAKSVFDEFLRYAVELGFKAKIQSKTLKHESGGRLIVLVVNEDRINEIAGCVFSHIYRQNWNPSVCSVLDSKQRVPTGTVYKTAPGVYTQYGANIKVDY